MYGGVYYIDVRSCLIGYYFNILGVDKHLHPGLDSRMPNAEALTPPITTMDGQSFPSLMCKMQDMKMFCKQQVQHKI